MLAPSLPELQPDPLFPLFDDERRLHEEVLRFLESATDGVAEPRLRAQLKAMLNVSGRRLRPLLPFWLSRAQGEPGRRDIARVSTVTLALHSAAIVIDDIEDDSVERQAQAALHLRHGLGPTLNAASLLIIAAIRYLEAPALVASALDAVARCHAGQALDLAFGDRAIAAELLGGNSALRRQRWLDCVRGKTSMLMEWSVRAAAGLLGLAPSTVETLGAAIVEYGVGYQMLDDVKNFCPDLVGRKAYEDLPSGLRNWVCLELLDELDGDERRRAGALYGSAGFADFVLSHPRLEAAIARSMAEAEARIAAARRALLGATGGRERGYLEALLDIPLEDLRHG